jgi:hypothetical protein
MKEKHLVASNLKFSPVKNSRIHRRRNGHEHN